MKKHGSLMLALSSFAVYASLAVNAQINGSDMQSYAPSTKPRNSGAARIKRASKKNKQRRK